jgi:cell division protein FtsA
VKILGVIRLAEDNLVAGLDIGTSKVAVVMALKDSLGLRKIVGVGSGLHSGVQRGVVLDTYVVGQAVTEAIIKAERMAKRAIPPAVVSIPCSLSSSFIARGTVAIKRSGHRVQAEDMERAISAAEAVSIPPGRRVIHRLIQGFWLDGKQLPGEPLGLVGRHLEVEVQFITIALSALEGLLSFLEQEDVKIAEMTVQCLATSDMVLTPSHRKLGVVLVDLGAGLTDIVVYHGAQLQHMACLPVGTRNLALDLVMGLNISLMEAECLVRELGCDFSPENIAKFREGWESDTDGQCLSLEQYTEIFMARAEEIWHLVRSQIAKVGGSANLQAGVRLVGGGVLIPGFKDLGSRILGLPVDATLPVEMNSLPESWQSPGYVSAVGLVQHRTTSLSVLSKPQAKKPTVTALWPRVRGWLKF